MAVVVSPSPLCDWEARYEQPWMGSYPTSSPAQYWPQHKPKECQTLPAIDLQPILDSVPSMLSMHFSPKPAIRTLRTLQEEFGRNYFNQYLKWDLQLAVQDSSNQGPDVTFLDAEKPSSVSTCFSDPAPPKCDLSRPLYSDLNFPSICGTPKPTNKRSQWTKLYGILKPHTSFPDTLFSSIASAAGGATYEPTNLCDLCHHPFETDDEEGLSAHLAQHLREFKGTFHCDECEISFSRKDDLDWHLTCGRYGRRSTKKVITSRHIPPGVDDDERFKFCIKLRDWEQAQLESHNRTIEEVCKASSRRRSSRPSSLPPRDRTPHNPTNQGPTEDDEPQSDSRRLRVSPMGPAFVDVGKAVQDSAAELLEETPDGTHGELLDIEISQKIISAQPPDSGRKTRGSSPNLPLTAQPTNETQHTGTTAPTEDLHNDVNRTVFDLQRRVLSLLERFQPRSPDASDQGTPYSNFRDWSSLPGSPDLLEEDPSSPFSVIIERAESEPPLTFERWAEAPVKQNGQYYGNANVSGGGLERTGGSGRLGQKRGTWERNSGEEDDEDGPGRNFQPKKRRVAAGSSADDEKRFPCVCYVGEPVRFASDVTRHKHISNMWYAINSCRLSNASFSLTLSSIVVTSRAIVSTSAQLASYIFRTTKS